jgi:hypothetical protein
MLDWTGTSVSSLIAVRVATRSSSLRACPLSPSPGAREDCRCRNREVGHSRPVGITVVGAGGQAVQASGTYDWPENATENVKSYVGWAIDWRDVASCSRRSSVVAPVLAADPSVMARSAVLITSRSSLGS